MRRFTHTFPQRISAFLLCLALLVGLLPATALAEGIPYLDENGTQQTAASATQVTNSDTQWTTGWYVVNSGVTINRHVAVSGDVHLILADGCNLNVSDGIVVEPENSLTIYAQSTKDSMGELTATRSTRHGAGIGGGSYGSSGGTVTINGGTVTATGSSGGAGIGGGFYGSGGTVTINGGTVTANGGDYGAGIGGGSGASDDYSGAGAGGTVAIYGGTVTATGGDYGAGIGGGAVLNSKGSISGAAGGQVTISGGRVKATGGYNAAGIGGGGYYDADLGGTPGDSGTFSTGQSGNAVIFASGERGGIQDTTKQENWNGVIFQGNEGQVYGSVALDQDLTIENGRTLTIPENSALDIQDGVTLTVAEGGTVNNYGTVENSGTLLVYGTLNGTVTYKVTGVKLDKTSLTLQENGRNILTAKVEPADATNKAVTWASSDNNIATVSEDGTVIAINAGTATITATAADGSGKSASCSVTVTHGNMVHTPKKDATCTVDGTEEYWTCEICGKHYKDESGTIPTTPEENKIPAVGHSFSGGTCTVCGAPDPNYTPPYIPPSKPNWTSVARKLANAQPGDTVTVKMNGETEVPGEVWETIAGRDVTVILDMGGNVSWTVDGNDVPTATHFADMDFGVDRNTTGIDVDVINAITGQVSSVQITLAHDGEFGFTLTLTAPLGRENAGYWANLYHYDEDAESLSYETSGEIQKDGTASLKMTHASQYAIIIDDQTHQLPFTDVTSGTWYESAVRYAYLHDIMEGMSATTFQPNGTLSRAMAVQIFYNLEGQPDICGENLGYPYEDVNAQAWYGNAVYWARITGVATGYGDGTFQPTDSITRQEFAQMLYNYAKYKGYDLSAEGDLSTFPDGNKVQEWAVPAMIWANGNELINGHDDGTLEPGGTATRAQAAAILMRFDQDLAE